MTLVLLQIIEGLAIGLISGVVLLYGLQPKEAYPSWMLLPFDHPWMFLVMVFVIAYVAYFNKLIAALLLLLVVSLYVDLIQLGRPTIFKRDKLPVPEDIAAEPVEGTPQNSVWDRHGIPLSSVVLDEPQYPTFLGMNDIQPGDPAAF